MLERPASPRAELFSNSKTHKNLTRHDGSRTTGITWMAVRGDDPLKIQHRAGHEKFVTTEGYIRTAEDLRSGFGSVFPPCLRTLRTARRRGRRAVIRIARTLKMLLFNTSAARYLDSKRSSKI
jgi:hypothetical protein